MIWLVASAGITNLNVTNDASEAMLPTGGDLLLIYETFLEEFPSDQTFIIVLENLVCTDEGWNLLVKLTDDLSRKNFVENTYSLAAKNAKYVVSDDVNIDIKPFRDVEFQNSQLRCDIASGYPPFSNILISRDKSQAAIYISADEELDAVTATNSVRATLEPYLKEAVNVDGRILVSGEAVLSAELSEAVSRDSMLIGLSVVLMVFVVFLLTQSLRATALVLTLIIFVLGAVFGFMGYTGIAYTPSTSLVVFLLIPLATAFVIHAHGYHLRSQDDEQRRGTKAFRYAGLTTAIGFACTGLTPASDIQNLAVVGVFGIVVILVGLVLFVSLHLEDTRQLRFRLGNQIPLYFFTKPLIGWIALSILLLLTGIGLANLSISYGPSDFLPDENKVKSDYLEVGNNFGRMNLPFIIEVDSVHDPDYWNKAKALVTSAKRNTSGNLQAIWFYDHMSPLASAFYNGSFKFPQSEEAFEQLELFFERTDTELFWNENGDKIAILFQIPFSSSADYLSFKSTVMKQARDAGLHGEFVGRVASFFETGHRIGFDTLRGLLVAAGLILMILYYLFRDFRLAAVGTTVNVIPVLFGLSILGLIGTPLEMGSSIVAAMSFGIVLDDSTHLLVQIDRLIKSGYDPDTATNKAIRDLVPPIVSTTIAISAGFLVLFLAEVTLFADFALLMSTTLACALLVDVWILPLLVKTILRERAFTA